MPTPTSMSNSLFVDTSGWVSIIGQNETFHQACSEAYQQAMQQKRGLVTTNYILTEVVALLINRSIVPRQQMIVFIDALERSPQLTILMIDRAVHDEAWALMKARADKAWSWVDASSFVIMRRLGITEALTTDHHFAQAGFVKLPAV